jgi:hypothetical protein
MGTSAPACYCSSLDSNPDISLKYKMGDAKEWPTNSRPPKQIRRSTAYRVLDSEILRFVLNELMPNGQFGKVSYRACNASTVPVRDVSVSVLNLTRIFVVLSWMFMNIKKIRKYLLKKMARGQNLLS